MPSSRRAIPLVGTRSCVSDTFPVGCVEWHQRSREAPGVGCFPVFPIAGPRAPRSRSGSRWSTPLPIGRDALLRVRYFLRWARGVASGIEGRPWRRLRSCVARHCPTSAAELIRVAVEHASTDWGVGLASTGPRPIGRGERDPQGSLLRRHRASTGPRPIGRGERQQRTTTSRSRASFNGAAPDWARRAALAHVSAWLGIRFNGAAPDWARRDPYGFEWVQQVHGLQRGRARLGAERKFRAYLKQFHPKCFNGAAPDWARREGPAQRAQSGMSLLQRGRARLGAESLTTLSYHVAQDTLQRGRARLGAESWSVPVGMKANRWCFNGAAPDWARRAPTTTNNTTPHNPASTGPRPIGRGESSS